jgi:hypothetical protein
MWEAASDILAQLMAQLEADHDHEVEVEVEMEMEDGEDLEIEGRPHGDPTI